MASFKNIPDHSVLVSALLYFLCVATLLFFRNFHRRARADCDEERPPITFRYRNIQQAKSILNGSCFEGSSLSTILKARAAPNDRLVRAFDIDNAFTTTDTKYHREFVNIAGSRINLSSTKWESLVKDIMLLLDGGIERQRAQNGTVILSRLLQITVLRAVLSILFPDCKVVDYSEKEQDDIAYSIADKINSLWIESKTTQQASLKDLQSLQEACQKLLPGIAVGSSRDNPLNLILPAFETLWRVVFRCFIEIQFRNKDDFGPNFILLQDYLKSPTSETFNKPDTRDISVSCIVNEGLRLYPPTKRVYRQIHTESRVNSTMVAIDIEYFHHDPEVWGMDATEFRPSRWIKSRMNGSMIAAFCPFGMKPLVCPARKVFGPRIIGLFVASLSVALSPSDEWEAVGGPDFLTKGPLENARDSYKSMGVRMRGKNLRN